MRLICDGRRLRDAITCIRSEVQAANDREFVRFDLWDHEQRSVDVPMTLTGASLHEHEVELAYDVLDAEVVKLGLRGLCFAHERSFPHPYAAVTIGWRGEDVTPFVMQILGTTIAATGALHSCGRFVGILEQAHLEATGWRR